MLKKLSCLLMLLLSACSTYNNSTIDNKKAIAIQSIQERQQQMSTLTQWQIKGKIAFIDGNKRQSANLHWQKNETNATQSINLSTVFGINLVKIKQNSVISTITFDDKHYQSNNIDQLLFQLTGFNLPTQAVSYWLKGLPFLPSDNITYHPKTLLPITLTSVYQGQIWQIDYSHYQQLGNFQLAKKLSIQQGNLQIKIMLYSWQL